MDAERETLDIEALDLEDWAAQLMGADPEDIDRALKSYRSEARKADLPEVRKLARQRIKAIEAAMKRS